MRAWRLEGLPSRLLLCHQWISWCRRPVWLSVRMQFNRIEYWPISAAGMSTCFGLMSRLSGKVRRVHREQSVSESLTYDSHLIGHLDGFGWEWFTHVQTFVRVGHFAQRQNSRIGDGCFVDLLNFLLNTVACLTWCERLSIEEQRSPVCFRQTRVGMGIGQILIEPLHDLRHEGETMETVQRQQEEDHSRFYRCLPLETYKRGKDLNPVQQWRVSVELANQLETQKIVLSRACISIATVAAHFFSLNH